MKKILFFLVLPFSTLFLGGCEEGGNYLKLKKDIKLGKEEEVVRKPVVAGVFYPSENQTLSEQIDDFLAKTKKVEAKGDLKILIVPHAGYSYSGQVAGWGFKQLEGGDYKRIIILGSSHTAYFDKAALWDKGKWETPLGEVEIDESLAKKLIAEGERIETKPDVHLQEHSLEVELPFLQKVLKDFRIVPILLGQTNDEVLQSLADTLAKNFDDKTLLVVSSDLSHYPPYEVANKIDGQTIEAILSGKGESFSQVIEKNLDQPGVDTCACGADAIKVAMMLAKELGISEIKLLKYENSGDTGGDKSRVVGYAAIGFYGPDEKQGNAKPQKAARGDSAEAQNEILNKKQQNTLLKIARQTLESYLKDDGKIPEFEVDDKTLKQKLGVFVTLRKEGQLRGCIGEFEPEEPLYKLVQKKAIDAALNDTRFYPVEYDELPSIKIEISVLSPPEKIDDWRKIELGKYGVLIKKGLRGGTFLPQVAEETSWNLEEFLSNLCRSKAGLPVDCYKDKETEIFIYTAQVFEEEPR